MRRPRQAPRANGVSHASSALRNASVSTKPAGVAPLAARSGQVHPQRLARDGVRADRRAGSARPRRWHPSSPRCRRRMLFSAAASSSRLNAPGSVAIGLKIARDQRVLAGRGSASHARTRRRGTGGRSGRAPHSPCRSRRFSTKACATSTYSDTTTRPGTSLRCSSS